MTTLTVRTELAAMDVGVAIAAVGADLLEYRIGVASNAINLLVHSTQWISGLIMIELRMRANWLPTRVGVAVLTGNRKGSMWVNNLSLGASYLRSIDILRLL